ncbi:cytochrome P450 [Actinophytocola sp.]|uniref:cytochrome P450 n=1 Tax=Actinophytocola sp. TaxID=1872138 RepID=UPI002D80BA14|nr:cytochrome P450 [Actinophytocola sp.]HET9138475.1 cytochrome P450 [Actinophytocola sp.]
MGNSTVTVPEFDLLGADDPLEYLLEIGARAPLCWVPKLHAYLVCGYDNVVTALRNAGLRSANATQGFERLSAAEQEELRPLRMSIEMWMGHTTPEGHHRFQHLLKRYFTPSTVNGLRPRIRQLTGELLDAAADGRMEVVADLAYPLPANIIAEMFGMPTDERDRLRVWSRHIGAVFQNADADTLRRSQASVLEMQDYLRGIVADRRARPRDDLISMFVAAERDGLVDEDEIVANCVLLLFAGHETTANLISHGLNLLLNNPDQLALLRSDPGLTPSAVEEMLRRDGPVITVVREAVEPVTVAGYDIPPGQHVFLAVYSANHDPAVFPDPLRFDITRRNNRHLAFGMGAYYCLGAALARVESDECFRLLLRRFPDLRPAADQPPALVRVSMRDRLEALPVEL